jgi:hypothetical protein
MPADKLAGLIGKQALFTLPVGTLVGPEAVGTLDVPLGQAVVGLTLSPGHVPIGVLPYGTQVMLVQAPKDTSATPATPWQIQAKVVKGSVTGSDGSALLDVCLDQADAAQAATLASQGALVVYRIGG